MSLGHCVLHVRTCIDVRRPRRAGRCEICLTCDHNHPLNPAQLHSLLFVVYMFFLNFIPRPDKTIPCPYSHNTWPPSVMTWVQPRPDTIHSVGGSKLAFFGEDTEWLIKLGKCSPDWFYLDGKPGPNNRDPKKTKYLGLVLALHKCLWATSEGPTKRVPSATVTPQNLLTALQTYKSGL
jgi:hypothetical protein